jgi:hypothetical protein
MALATRKSNVGAVYTGTTSNHDHAVVVDDHGRLPEFLEHLLRTQPRIDLNQAAAAPACEAVQPLTAPA